jgi:hypothetical protein
MTYNSVQGAMDKEFEGLAAVGFRGQVSDLIRLSSSLKDFRAEGKKGYNTHP